MYSLRLQFLRIIIVFFSMLILFCITAAPDRHPAEAHAGAASALNQCGPITINPAELPDGSIGTSYSKSLSASGGLKPYNYSLLTGALPPGLTLASTGLISGTPTTAGSYNFTARVRDAGNCFGSRAYAIDVSCPTITVTPATLAVPYIGIGYLQTFSASGGTGPYSFGTNVSALPPGLAWNTNGTLRGRPTTAGSYSFIVRANDANGCFGERSYTLVVDCPAITFTPSSLPPAVVGTFYDTTLIATGGPPGPYSFSILSCCLPTGLALHSDGRLTGTAASEGSHTFTVRATDANGCTGDRTYTLRSVVCHTITLTNMLFPGRIGNSYSSPILASGGYSPISFSVSGALPAGLRLDPAGLLSGWPTEAGDFNFTIVATDANGCTGSRLYHLFIDPCPFIRVILDPVLLDATISTPYSATYTAAGGLAPVTLSQSSGVLPPGLTFNPATGVLSGSPTQYGQFIFTITATDANGCTGNRGHEITVRPPCPAITALPTEPNLPIATVGTPYNQTLSATGGAAPYQADMLSGTLPAGVSFNLQPGVLAGTPTSPGTFTFTVRFVDAGQCQGQRTYTLVVNSAPCSTIGINPANSSLPTGIVGAPYTLAFTGTGGTAPYAFRIIVGAAPGGLTFSSAGDLTGAPTTAGGYHFVVLITDANGCVGGAEYNLVVNNPTCPVITLSPTERALPPGLTDKGYSQIFSATGGAAPYSFTVSAGALPPGSSLSSEGELTSTGFTVAGSYSFTVRVADGNGCVSECQYTLIVNNIGCSAITVNPEVFPNGTVGSAYIQTITATGDAVPYDFTISAGALPAGLTLNATTGVLAGTPTAAGPAGFTVRATDANGCIGERAFTIIIDF
ncbi:MAG TPA: Ig domain-containing protein [Blastocatellia bacterium]|nr:Ig domain-containing protein [Blastocatellia bacterium]